MEENNILRMPSIFGVSRYRDDLYMINASNNNQLSRGMLIKLLEIIKNHLAFTEEKRELIDEEYRMIMDSIMNRRYTEEEKNKVFKKSGFVYVLSCENGYKIGRSKTPKRPEKLSEVLLPVKMEIELMMEVDDYISLEKDLHEIYKHKRIKGEWFDLIDDDVIDIQAYLMQHEVGV